MIIRVLLPPLSFLSPSLLSLLSPTTPPLPTNLPHSPPPPTPTDLNPPPYFKVFSSDATCLHPHSTLMCCNPLTTLLPESLLLNSVCGRREEGREGGRSDEFACVRGEKVCVCVCVRGERGVCVCEREGEEGCGMCA